MRISYLLGALLALLVLLGSARARAYDVEVLQQTGPSSNRIDLLILGDGYRAGDQAQLTQNANDVLNRFWAQNAFGAYRSFFNVKLVHVVSNQNGADNGSFGTVRDTALGTFFFCAGIDRLICADDSAVFNVAASHAPEFDQILVLVNDPMYGGSGGSFSISSIDPSAGDITVHEVGHSMMGLADEYDYGNNAPVCSPDCSEPNVTTQTNRSLIKWNAWIQSSTPIPTPETSQFDTAVGLFEGAKYQPTGNYRPWNNCVMKELGREFCPVCSEQTVLRVYNTASLIDGATPTSPVSLAAGGQVTFRVPGARPVPNTVLITWLLDGNTIQSGSSDTLVLNGTGLAAGTHTLEARLEDDTLLVRRDPLNLLIDTATWQVTVSGSGGTTLINASFNSGSDSFSYVDDAFRSTNQPNYASGRRISSGGFENSGALQVNLGGVNSTLINNMSGGYRRTFNLTSPATVIVSLRYNLTQSPNYESNERSELLVSLDGALKGTAPNDFVASVVGNGNGGANITTGWRLFELNVGSLTAGAHTLTLGGYNNRKDNSNETTDIRLDAVLVRTQ